jgi:type VI protein secretion system component VasF
MNMALFIRQDDQRSELQSRLAAELQERARQKDKIANLPDGVDDSQYIKGTKETTSLAWVWAVIIISAILIAIGLMVLNINIINQQ